MNKVILFGSVTNIEPRQDKSLNLVLTFTLVTQKAVKKPHGYEYEPLWHRIVFFGARAQSLIDRLEIKDKLLVEGRIDYSEYISKEGVKKINTTIIGDSYFLNKPKNDKINTDYNTDSETIKNQPIDYLDSIPF